MLQRGLPTCLRLEEYMIKGCVDHEAEIARHKEHYKATKKILRDIRKEIQRLKAEQQRIANAKPRY